MNLQRWIFGDFPHSGADDLALFRYRLLLVVLIAGAFFTALFLLGNASSLNPLHGRHMVSMWVFTIASMGLWFILRGHPERYLYVAWTYEALCLTEYTSALIFVPQDEMRIFWFATNIPGAYILLGKKAGLAISIAIVLGVALGNGYLPLPYSHNGLATFLVGAVYLAAFFHVFVDRALFYYSCLRQSLDRLAFVASHDPLTGLLNARTYNENADQLILLMSRLRRPYVVFFVDIDHFKRINDTYGHLAGDSVLQEVAHCLKSHSRDSDLVGRVGGEEFSIFLPDTAQDSAAQFAENLRIAIEQLRPIAAGRPLDITASIGIAVSDGTYAAMSSIQQQADMAMYKSKALGRNRVTMHEAIANVQ
jgi:diguanylate cyclase (GGDEF)-like protein